MEQISRQLLYQRLRNRVIELVELHTAPEDIAIFGAFEVVNMVDDYLPLDYEEAPNVFSNKEKHAIDIFLKLAEFAADATARDTCDVQWLKKSPEWSKLSEFSRQLLAIFLERGRFSEYIEELSRI